MPIRDMRKAPPDLVCQTDIALIGAGPVGLTIAAELAGTRIHVTLIDSGGFAPDATIDNLNAVDNVGEPKLRPDQAPIGRGYTDQLAWLNDVAPFELRQRGLGGSSRTWVGKCAAFDAHDFERRDWVPGSGWPIDATAMAPFFDRAGALLNLGPNAYDDRLLALLKSPPRTIFGADSGLRPFFWQFSHERDRRGEPMRFVNLARRLDAPNVDILTHATAIRIARRASHSRGGIVELRMPDGRHARLSAGAVVLCCGGIENARLLLNSRTGAADTASIGNAHGVVGRYLADHPRTVLARFPAETAAAVARRFTFHGLAENERRNFYLHGLSPSPETQQREKMLNCAAYPVQQLAEDDPWRALRRLAAGPGRDTPQDLLALITAPLLMGRGLWDRLHARRGMPRRLSELRFDVMLEQRPNPMSRVTLSRKLDMFGMPLPRVDWRIGEQEIDTVRKFARMTSAAFIRAGLPEPLLPAWALDPGNDDIAFMDMAHPSGTTRMGTDRKTSVVDADCMIHDAEGIFVAGSSVFPTVGHANPTLTILALAMRLSDHLRAYIRDPAPSTQPAAATVEAAPRIRPARGRGGRSKQAAEELSKTELSQTELSQ